MKNKIFIGYIFLLFSFFVSTPIYAKTELESLCETSMAHVSVLQSNNRVFSRLYNPNSGSSGDRTVISAVDAITPHSLITVSFDSLFDGSVIPTGSFFLGAGIGSLASHQNQIRKVFFTN